MMNNNNDKLDQYSDDEIRDQIKNFYKNLEKEQQPEREKIKVLIVDDEERNLSVFQALFRREFDVTTANSGKEAIDILDSGKKVHVIITDQRMPEMTGIEFLQNILQKHNKPIRVLLTGYSDINAVIDAINKGEVYRYLNKPFEKEDMKMLINNAYEIYYLREKAEKLQKDLATANAQLEFMLRGKLLDDSEE